MDPRTFLEGARRLLVDVAEIDFHRIETIVILIKLQVFRDDFFLMKRERCERKLKLRLKRGKIEEETRLDEGC